ncbi:hypothetical protein NDU88_003507 [Pleurodeles waltl]|uniref:Uncharacterized protein n=1 Tax=Pleurodeles waltl TaxID=8319 RepID=A0AAV7LIR0_PLEWA|nr:hypothetical protein NDU88_003507 [Pleurodeles waltl]
MRDLFHSIGEWWKWVKDKLRSFFQDASRAAAQEKKSEFRRLEIPGISKTPGLEYKEGLNMPFTMEELHLVATTSKRGKAARSDGLPVELYVELWDLIGLDLLDL